MAKLSDIQKKIRPRDRKMIHTLRHPHYQTLKYYPHKVGITRRLGYDDICWLNNNTKGRYSQDFTIPPHNVSFEVAQDAILFKMSYGANFTCAPRKN